MSNQPFEISIAGIWCGSGIVRVKKAIQAVPGVTAVKLDLPRSIAIVEGTFDPAAVAVEVAAVVRDAEARAARGSDKAEGGCCG
jgi:copper chaperone CopZ